MPLFIVSLEKCTGQANGTATEDAIYANAMKLKKNNPGTKVFFYWATDQQGIHCYKAGDAFNKHPEWHLKDDEGNVYLERGGPILDASNADARAWWTSIPLLGDGDGTYKGTPVSELIDGVLADSAGYGPFKNMSIARCEKLIDAKYKMMGDLQSMFTKANGGMVMANGISMYGGANADPRRPKDHNLEVLKYTNSIMNEHTAVFELVNSKNASLKVDDTSQNLDAILAAAKMDNGSKTVFIQSWPGLYANTNFRPSSKGPASVYPPVANGGEPTPQNNEEWRAALRSHFAFAHALFLSIATPNTYWFYGAVWYSTEDGYLPCPENLNRCPAPPEWYPDLEKPLGAPLGDRKLIAPYVWEREFEHAKVHVDLNQCNNSKVTFK